MVSRVCERNSSEEESQYRRDYLRLMSAASRPEDMDTLALGGVLARFQMQATDPSDLECLLRNHFPGIEPADLATSLSGKALCEALSTDEIADLLALLNEFRRDDSAQTRWVMHAIVSACAGSDHLWQDMGLPSREVLSQLIRRHFPVLYYKNSSNMKWKKFFYRLLCERAAVRVCKAPSCGVCTDYDSCFGERADNP